MGSLLLLVLGGSLEIFGLGPLFNNGLIIKGPTSECYGAMIRE
jgi:hypothetical protein